jgi:hypothetical protein
MAQGRRKKITISVGNQKPQSGQGHCGLAAFQQGQNLQVHHVSIMVGRNTKWFPLTKKKFMLSQGHWQ